MSRNLLKAGYVVCNSGEKLVIDNNKRLAERLELLERKNILPHTGKTPKAAGVQENPLEAGQEAALFEAGEGFQSGLAAESVELSAEAPAGPTAEEIAAQAAEEAERIRQEAYNEAQDLKSKAYEEGRQQGYTDGYNEGMQEVRQLEQQLDQQLREKESLMEQQYRQKVEELEPQFVDVMNDIYEHIFRIKLSDEKALIMNLLEGAIKGIEGSRDYIVHVSQTDYETVKASRAELEERVISGNATLEIIEDSTLGKNECMIETGSGIFDCSLGTQLKELQRQLKLLSYEK